MDIVTLQHFSHPDPTVKRKTGVLMPIFGYQDLRGRRPSPLFHQSCAQLRSHFACHLDLETRLAGRCHLASPPRRGPYYVKGDGLYQLYDDQPPPRRQALAGLCPQRRANSPSTAIGIGAGTALSSAMSIHAPYDIDERDEIVNQLYLTGINDRNYMSAQALLFPGSARHRRPAICPWRSPMCVTTTSSISRSSAVK